MAWFDRYAALLMASVAVTVAGCEGEGASMSNRLGEAGKSDASDASGGPLGRPISGTELEDLLADSRLHSSNGGFDVYLRRDGSAIYRVNQAPGQGPGPIRGRYSISGNRLCVDDFCFEVYQAADPAKEVLICQIGAQRLGQCANVKIQKGGK